MTGHTPPTDQQLDEIEARAAGLYEYAAGLDDAWQAEADQLAGTDVPALVAEVRRQRAELATVTAERAAIYREAARIADKLPTPDDCEELSSFANAWDCGTYAVGDELRRLADEQQGERPEFTDGLTAWMQIGSTPSLAGLRAELRVDGYPPLIGRYAGAGMRKSKQHDDWTLIEPMLVFVDADDETSAAAAVVPAVAETSEAGA